ncbi:MAG: PLxRFG domain-containing protein [Sphaerochaeta sp.]|jgi:N12 class adenine-specific DNA methylase/predicted RNA methylase|nr:PLxRFG domain-containing protein [Sphaerochaeta sp.]
MPTVDELLSQIDENTSGIKGKPIPRDVTRDMSVDDMLAMVDEVGVEPVADADPGVFSALGRGVAQGFLEIPAMAGQALQFAGAEDVGKSIEDWSKETSESLLGKEPEYKGLNKIIYEGTKMLAPSIVPAGVVGTGLRSLFKIGKIVKAAKAAKTAAESAQLLAKADKLAKVSTNIASGSTAGLFGLSQAQQTIQNAEQTAKQYEAQGRFEEAAKAREAAKGWAPYVSGGIEAAGEYLGTKYLGKLLGLDEATAFKRGGKELVKDFLKTLGVEVGTEFGQSGGESAVEKVSGIRPEAHPLKEALDVIGPTVWMTILTGGFATGANMIRPDQQDNTALDDQFIGDIQRKLSDPNDPLDEATVKTLLKQPQFAHLKDRLQGVLDTYQSQPAGEGPVETPQAAPPQPAPPVTPPEEPAQDMQEQPQPIDEPFERNRFWNRSGGEILEDLTSKEAYLKQHFTGAPSVISDMFSAGVTKGVQSASQIRSDEGEVYQPGIEDQGREDEGGQDIRGDIEGPVSGGEAPAEGQVEPETEPTVDELLAQLDEPASQQEAAKSSRGEEKGAEPVPAMHQPEAGQPVGLPIIEKEAIPSEPEQQDVRGRTEGEVAKQPFEMSREDVVWQGFAPDGMDTDRALQGRLKRWEKIQKEAAAEGRTVEAVEQAIAKEKARIERANSHRAAVQQAIKEGKITSHPDYPELGKPTVKESLTVEKQEQEKIEAAVIRANGKIFKGKTHGQAIDQAETAGEITFDEDGDILDKEGNPLNRDGSIDLFITNYGRILNRFEALNEFGIASGEGLQKGSKVAEAVERSMKDHVSKQGKNDLTNEQIKENVKRARETAKSTRSEAQAEKPTPDLPQTEAVTPEPNEAQEQPDHRHQWESEIRFFRSGKSKNAELPDGEKVILNIGSTPKNFLDLNRSFFDSIWKNKKSGYKPKTVPETKPEEQPLDKLRRDLESKGAGRIGNSDFSIQQLNTGLKSFYYQKVKNGVRYEKGPGYPASWSRERAIEEAMEEAEREAPQVPAGEDQYGRQWDNDLTKAGRKNIALSIGWGEAESERVSKTIWRHLKQGHRNVLIKNKDKWEQSKTKQKPQEKIEEKTIKVFTNISEGVQGIVTEAPNGFKVIQQDVDSGEVIGIFFLDDRKKAYDKAHRVANMPAPHALFEGDYIDEKGYIRLSKERRKKIIEYLFKGKTGSKKDPQVILTGGLPGAGKSTGKKGIGFDKEKLRNFVEADPDAIKELAGYGHRADDIHEESSEINNEVVEKALDERYDLVYDSLMSNYAKAKRIIDKTLASGGRIFIAFTEISAETSQVRSQVRYWKQETDRLIKESVSIKGANYSLPTFLKLIDEYEDNPKVNWILLENNEDQVGVIQIKPVRVAQKKLGETTVLNPETFDKFKKIGYSEVKGGKKYARGGQREITESDLRREAISRRVGDVIRGWAGTPREGFSQRDEALAEREEPGKEQEVIPQVPPKKKAAESTADELLAEWDRQAAALQEQPKNETQTKPAKKPTARDKSEEVRDHISKAMDVVRQINSILGEEGSIGAGDQVDQTKWEKIKPLLKIAWDEVLAAGKSAEEFVAIVLKSLSPKGRPYFKKFIEEEIHEQIRIPAKRIPGGEAAREASEDEGVGNSGQIPAEEVESGDKAEVYDDKIGDAGEHGGRSGVERPYAIEDYRITKADELGQGGPKAKFRNNIAAIKLISDLKDRQATPEEQSILAKYVGWGGLSQAFVRPDGTVAKGWEAEASELKDLLPPEEYAAARSSTQDAHYTSEPVIKAIYSVINRFGFKGGKVLEPSVGVGNFIGLMPASMKGKSHITGVEIDSTTATIAKQLYPKQNIVHSGFQDFTIAPNSFDLAIGNPPFGAKTIFDQKHPDLKHFSIHNFFFAKSLKASRPNGVMAMVVSSSMMDKRGGAQREWISSRAELIGAVRLPNVAFKGSAGTEVTTDIVFLRKLDEGEKVSGHKWQELGQVTGPDGIKYNINEYYIAHPEMVLGDIGPNKLHPGEIKNGVYDAIPGLLPRDDWSEAVLNEALSTLPAHIYKKGKPIEQVESAKTIVADAGFARPFGFTLDKNGRAVRRLPDVNGEQVFEPVLFSGEPLQGTRLDRFKGMLRIRDVLRQLIQAEINDSPGMDILRKQLNSVYDNFVKEYGYLSSSANDAIFADDPTDYPLLVSLETDYDKGVSKLVAKKTGEKARQPSASKANIFKERIRQPYRAADKADSTQDGLAIVLREDGVVDIARIAALTGKSEEDTIKELAGLAFLDPKTEAWETADSYLSGNVKKKLAEAKDAATKDDRFIENVKSLEKVQPKDVPSELIRFKVGATWIPADIYQKFAADVLQSPTTKIAYNENVNIWTVSGDSRVSSPLQTDRISAVQILTDLLKNKDIAIWDKDNDGKRYINQEETIKARAKADEMHKAFYDWAMDDNDIRDRLTVLFNEKVNTTIEIKTDGSHMIFPGMGIVNSGVKRDDQLLPHQKNVVWRMIQKGKGLLDHVVGSGKTFSAIAAGMEMKRMGMVNKPMYVVPNHLVQQWAIEFQRLYPAANVLVIGKKDFAKANRQTFLGRIATGSWDAVLMAHSSFGFIKMPFEFEMKFYRDQVAQYEEAITELTASEGKKSRTVKQMEEAKDRLVEKLKALADKPKDNVVDFSELGVDSLFIDEAHEFKNLFYVTKRQRVAGLGNQQGSKKAFDMFVKTQFVLSQNNGRGAFFLTGTPVSNSIAEMYTMMRYLDYDRLSSMGIKHFDQWANMFAEVQGDWEVDPTGTRYRLQSKMDFTNLPGLMSFYKDFSDVVSTADLQKMAAERGQIWPIPDVKGGKPFNVIAERSDYQKNFMEWVVDRFDNMPDDPREDNPLKATGDAMKASLDIRLIRPDLPDFAGSKVNLAVDNIMRKYQEWNHKKGAQLVFCDLSVPQKAASKHAAEISALRMKIKEAEKKLEAATPETESELEEKYLSLVGQLDKYSPAELMAAESRFSVYDDVKAKLISKGIPAEEVAFIHDANTDAQKEELFGKVRSGRVRVMIGSTSKMGAGMNVQDRLVALHHLDATWRPSDLEQREGRIVRQGNKLFLEAQEAGKKFEVEIFRYATNQTLDTRRWQVIERKATSIGKLRAGNFEWGETIEDATGEAANAAEMKAAASGNPLILEEIQLRQEIKKKEALISGEKTKKRRMENNIRSANTFLSNYDEYIKEFEADYQKVKDNPRDRSPQGWTISVNGTEYRAKGLVSVPEKTESTNKKEIQANKTAIEEAEKHNNKALETAKGEYVNDLLAEYKRFMDGDTDELSVEYRGIEFECYRIWQKASFKPVIKGREYPFGFLDWLSIDYNKQDNFNGIGFITRMDNVLSKIEGKYKSNLEFLETTLEQKKKSLKIAEKELGNIKDYEPEIKSARDRHTAVLQQLRQTRDTGTTEEKDFSMWTNRAPVQSSKEVPEEKPAIKETGNKYKVTTYINDRQGFTYVDGEPVDIVDGIDTFVHKEPGEDTWAVSEVITGMKFPGHWKSKKEAISHAREDLSTFGEDKLRTLIKDNPLPDNLPEEKFDLFNPTEEQIRNTRITVNQFMGWMRTSGIPKDNLARLEIQAKAVVEHLADYSRTMREHGLTGAPDMTRVKESVAFLDNMRTVVQFAENQTLTSAERAAYHAGFHVIVNTMMDNASREHLLSIYRGNEERAADAYSAWVQRQETSNIPKSIKKIFFKLRTILNRIRSFYRKAGYTKAEDFFSKMYFGGYGATQTSTQAEMFDINYRHPSEGGQQNVSQAADQGGLSVSGEEKFSVEPTEAEKSLADVLKKYGFDQDVVAAGEDLSKTIKANGKDLKKQVNAIRKDKGLFRSMMQAIHGVEQSKDMRWYHSSLEVPYVLGKKFDSMKQAMETELSAAENRAEMLFTDYSGRLGDLQKEFGKSKNKALLNQLEDLIWKWDGKKFNETDVPTQWYSEDEDTGEISINEQHYKEMRAYLEKQNVSPLVVDAFVEIRKKFDEKFIDALLTMQTDKADPTLIEEYRSAIKKISNYFPHKRHGDSYIQIFDEREDDPKKQLVYREHFFKVREILLPKDKMAKARAEAWLKEAIKSGELTGSVSDYRIDAAKELNEFPQEAFFNVPVDQIQQVVAEAGRRLEAARAGYEAERLYNKEGRAPDEAMETAKKRLNADMEAALSQAVADVFKAIGWARHSIGRKNIAGFDKTDVFGTMFDYMSGYAGFKTKMTRAREHHKTISNISAKASPNEYKYVTQYVHDMLENQTQTDRVVDAIRGAFFVKYLGGVIKSGIVNLTQNIVMAMPVLSMHTKGANLKLSKAMYDVKRALTSKEAWTEKEVQYKNLASNEQKAVNELHEKGASLDLFLRELKGNIPGTGYGKHVKRAIDKAGIFMQLAERFNRTSTGLAAYRVAFNEGVKLDDGRATKGDHAASVQFAKQIIYDSHFVYGRHNLPSAFRGGKFRKYLRSGYTFRTFTHNYLDIMSHLMLNQGKAGKLAAARSIRNLALLGGLTSVPFFKILSDVLMKAIGDDDEDAMTKLRAMMPSPFMRDLITYGLPGAVAGVDLTGSISIETPRNWGDLIGVPYSIGEDLSNMYDSWTSGQKWRALMESPVTPIALRNASRGLELYVTGQRTRSGADINAPGETGPKKISAIEAVKKSLVGLQPTSVSKGFNAYLATNKMRGYLAEKKSKLIDRYVNAYKSNDKDEMKAVTEEVRQWNEKAIKEGKEYRIIKDFQKSVRTRMRRTPMQAIPKAQRGEAQDIYSTWK